MTSEEVARAWVGHLRGGGTTPWRSFRAAPVRGEQDPGPWRDPAVRLPGAAQLEVLRRLADTDRAVPAAAFAALADRALGRTGPGRGLPELPLELVPTAASAAGTAVVGARPTDPGDVPEPELLRVATGLLVAELLRRDDLRATPRRRRPGARGPKRWPARLRGRSVVVDGSPVLAGVLRGALLDAGCALGGPRPEVLVVGGPLDAGLAAVWAARAEHGGTATWRALVSRWARRDALPRSLDLPALAASWTARNAGPGGGAGRVHVLLGDPLVGATDALGLDRPLRAGRRTPGVTPLAPAATEVLRRANRVLAVRAGDAETERARSVLVGLLADQDSRGAAGGAGLRVPAVHAEWLTGRAHRVAEDLARGGYPVLGDPAGVVAPSGGPERPPHPEVLALLLDTVRGLAWR